MSDTLNAILHSPADVDLTEKGRQYAEAHTKAPGSPAGAVLPFKATKRRRIGKTMLAALRKELAARVEEAIAMLDMLDGEWDLEPWLGPAQGNQLAGWKGGPEAQLEGDELDSGEEDRSDEEPSLGSESVWRGLGVVGAEEDEALDQSHWSRGADGRDLESVNEDGSGPHEDGALRPYGAAEGAAEEAQRLLAKVSPNKRQPRGDDVRPTSVANSGKAGGILILREDGVWIGGPVR